MFTFSGEDERLSSRLAAEPGFIKATRWILEPHGEQRLMLKCFADEEGDILASFHFRVVGDPQIFKIDAKATCCLPKLLDFPEGCFERVIQKRDAQQGTRKTYVSSEVRDSTIYHVLG